MALLGASLALGTLGAQAQFTYVPMPLQSTRVPDSQAETPQDYRADAARVIYGAFPMLISRGTSLETVMDKAMVAIDIGPDGKAQAVRLLRAPTMDEIGPWILALVRRIERFPVPARLKQVTYTDIWLLEESGQFRLGALADPTGR